MLYVRPARVPSHSGQGEETAIASMAHPVAFQLTIGGLQHQDLHVAHANDQFGRSVATVQIPIGSPSAETTMAWATPGGWPW